MGVRKQPTAGTAGAGRKRGWFVASRATFWLFWALSSLVSSAFAVLALISFAQMHRVHNTADFTGRRQIRGPMAAEFFGAVAVVFTNVMALFTLLWKSARRHGTGFGYGYVVASYGISGLWLVLSGIVMWAGNDKSLWQTTPHWGHGVSVAYGVAFVLAWVTAGIYLLTWAMLFFFRRSFSQPATVVGDAETGMTGMTTAYPAANTYTSPAYASSPRATAPTKGWFARKPNPSAAPLAAGAPVAAATATNGTTANPTTAPTGNTTQAPVGPLENASHTHAQTSGTGQYGAFTQHNGHHRGNSELPQEQAMQAVPAAAAEGAGSNNLVYARETEMTPPVGPSGVTTGGGLSQADQSHNVMNTGNKAGFFQSA